MVLMALLAACLEKTSIVVTLDSFVQLFEKENNNISTFIHNVPNLYIQSPVKI